MNKVMQETGSILPDYKKPEELRKFVTERGKIISRSRNGLNAREQREIAKNIKRARHLGLLPFSS